MKRFHKKALLALPLSGALVLAACGDNNEDGNTGANGNDAANGGNQAAENNEAAEGGLLDDNNGEAEVTEGIDMEADPDETIATVNGEEIKMEELQTQMGQYEMIFAQQGLDFEDEENAELLMQLQQDVVNQLVDQEILSQEAEAQGIEVNEEEVEQELEQIKGQFESDEQFEEALEMQNYTIEDLEDEIRQMKQVEELQSMAHLDEDAYDVSEEEAREYYEQIALQNPEIGEFEDVQADLEEDLKMNQYLDDLREDADVEIHI